jgi:hypothetical protein
MGSAHQVQKQVRLGRRQGWLLAGLIVLAGACKPKPGGTCSGDRVECLDGKTELICQDGKLLATPCKGPKGCKISGTTLTCDVAGNAAGDDCARSQEGHSACSTDGKHVLECRDGKYESRPCLGPRGCKQEEGRSICDISIAEANQSCGKDAVEQHACTPDKKHLLSCRLGKMVALRECPKGCLVGDKNIECEEAPAPPPDAGAPTPEPLNVKECDDLFAKLDACRAKVDPSFHKTLDALRATREVYRQKLADPNARRAVTDACAATMTQIGQGVCK